MDGVYETVIKAERWRGEEKLRERENRRLNSV